jgi:hypothetical protein
MERKQITLTSEERMVLEQFSKKGVHSVRLVNRAKIILALDTSQCRKAEKQAAVAKRVGVSVQTVWNARNDFLAAGSAEVFLQRKKRGTPPVPPKVTGEVEARIIALACGPVPSGYARWTLRLLAEKSVEMHYSPPITAMTVGRLLKNAA